MTYYRRHQWGARTPVRRVAMTRDVRGIALHWPAMGSRRVTTTEQAMEALRGWQRQHMDDQGWDDIGYQEAVDQLGNAYELRGFTIRSGANGNTTVNNQYGALLLILGEGEPPSEAMIRTVRDRIATWRRFWPGANVITGHGAIRPGGSECPGPIVRRLIADGTFNSNQEDDMPTPEEIAEAVWLYEVPATRAGNHGGPARVLLRSASRSLTVALDNREQTAALREVLRSKGIAGATADEIIDELADRLAREDHE